MGEAPGTYPAYCSRLNLSGGDQQKKVAALSGGERNRVHLARMLKQDANVLLLDEPTNALDVKAIRCGGCRAAPPTRPALITPRPPRSHRRSRALAGRALEDAIEQFAGCVIVISHDRWFLDRIATHLLAFEGDSKVTFFDGIARRAGWGARCGLQVRRPEPRGWGGGGATRRPKRARCSGNFSDYEDWRKQTLGDAASRPHRTTYRGLTR
jgi:ATPase subunit of ABC transporter with duplicated ATPase domains